MKKFRAEFIGIDKSEIHLQEAQELGIIDRFENFENGIKTQTYHHCYSSRCYG